MNYYRDNLKESFEIKAMNDMSQSQNQNISSNLDEGREPSNNMNLGEHPQEQIR